MKCYQTKLKEIIMIDLVKQEWINKDLISRQVRDWEASVVLIIVISDSDHFQEQKRSLKSFSKTTRAQALVGDNNLVVSKDLIWMMMMISFRMLYMERARRTKTLVRIRINIKVKDKVNDNKIIRFQCLIIWEGLVASEDLDSFQVLVEWAWEEWEWEDSVQWKVISSREASEIWVAEVVEHSKVYLHQL